VKLCAAVAGLALLAASQASAADELVSYKVHRGETLYQLSRAFFPAHGSMARVARLNRIANASRILTGGTLKIPRALLRDEQAFARVESFSGAVTLRPAGAAFPARTGATVGEGAAIETGRDGFISLRLADDSVVSIPSLSKVRIVRLRRVLLTGSIEREFSAEAGRVRARVTPLPDPASTFRVRTPLTVSAVRGTEFRIEFLAATGTAVTGVEEGNVEVTPAAATTMTAAAMIMPGFGSATTADGTTGAMPLLTAPRLGDADTLQTQPQLHFTLAPVGEATGYRIQIARDAGLLDLVAESDGTEPEFVLATLPAGTYFARITARDASGIEGMARTYAFDRVLNAVAGSQGASGTGRERRYLFKWGGSADGTPQYRFQLASKDDPAHPLVDEPMGTGTELSITSLPPGEYGWRVLSLVPRGDKVIRAWTGEQSFEVAGGK
jgi:hypothetical protein